MIMSSLSRHIACKLCRDRKVRCDGGQPSCEKCTRSGENCIYVPTHKPTKADLAQTIEALQERLDKAEAYILKNNPSRQPGTYDPPPVANPTGSTGTDYAECSPFALPMSTSIPTGDTLMPASRGMPSTPFSSHHPLPISPDGIDNEFLTYIHSPQAGVQDVPPFQMEDLSCPIAASSPFRHSSVYSHRHMPALQEVRALNGSSTSTTPPPSSPAGNFGGGDANHILAELTAFGMVVFNTQAEIAGISSVVAEYLEWMRKAPPGQGSPKENPAVLEALERRIREVNALANAKHMEAWRRSVQRLEKLPGVGAMLNIFDGEMQRRSAETADFFHTNYDICSTLPEQIRKD
ncbi:hypothetical protein F5Y18DRAFT_189016 [Xylariaceae sp. FL1019]|nr:hypothetical protein F5Y18DRAFT_189016 [Xylariaceae sp. FL1019]